MYLFNIFEYFIELIFNAFNLIFGDIIILFNISNFSLI